MKNINFYKRIAVVGADIPAGKVVTYGQLALLCGKPNNARQVGYALNRGRMGRDFPAYKVVNGQGYLSGAASFARPDMQKKLLESEGIEVKKNNRVNLKKYGWHYTLADAERFYALFLQMDI